MVRRILAASLTVIVLAILAVPLPAQAADGDRAAFKALVEEQLDAFRRDDAAAAYDRASPGIQQMFPSPEVFIGMVREAYPPVYRSRAAVFGEVRDGLTGPEEQVFITAADGSSWVAVYSFERQKDGSWKISGCRLMKNDAPTI